MTMNVRLAVCALAVCVSSLVACSAEVPAEPQTAEETEATPAQAEKSEAPAADSTRPVVETNGIGTRGGNNPIHIPVD